MTLPLIPSAVYTPETVIRDFARLSDLLSGSRVTRCHVHAFDRALSRLDAYPSILAITFTRLGDVIGSGPGKESTRRIGFIAPAPGGADSSFLALRSGREQFRYHLMDGVQEINVRDYDLEDSHFTQFRTFLHSLLVFVDEKRRGYRKPNIQVLSAFLPRQAASGVEIFSIPGDAEIEQTPRDHGPHSGPAVVTLRIPERPVVITEAEFDALIFNPTSVEKANRKPGNE